MLSEVKNCTVMVITSYLENHDSLSNLDNPFSKLLLINVECQYLSKSMTATEWWAWAILFYILPSNCLLIPVHATSSGKTYFRIIRRAEQGQGRARSDTEILQSPGEDMFCFPMWVFSRASHKPSLRFRNYVEGSYLGAFTFETSLRHYAKQAL